MARPSSDGLIRTEAAVLDLLRAMRRPHDNPSDVDWGHERDNALQCDDTGCTAGMGK